MRNQLRKVSAKARKDALRKQMAEWKRNYPRWLGDNYHQEAFYHRYHDDRIKALRKKYKEKGICLTFKEARKRYQAGEYA